MTANKKPTRGIGPNQREALRKLGKDELMQCCLSPHWSRIYKSLHRRGLVDFVDEDGWKVYRINAAGEAAL